MERMFSANGTMRLTLLPLATALLALAHAGNAAAQSCPALHHCYYVPPLMAPEDESPATSSTVSVELSTIYAGTARVALTYGGSTENLTVTSAPTVRAINPALAGTSGFNAIGARGVFIDSDRALSVLLRELGGTLTDIASIKVGERALGNRFMIIGYGLNVDPAFDVLSVYAPTGATVTMTKRPNEMLTWADGFTGSATIPPGQTLLVRTSNGFGLTGMVVDATAPIAVLVGGRGTFSATAPADENCRDDGFDNVLPLTHAGTAFVIHGYGGSNPAASNAESFTIIATNTDPGISTIVTVGGANYTLNGSASIQLRRPDLASTITANRPVLVKHDIAGFGSCELGMVLVPPVSFSTLSSPIDFRVTVPAGGGHIMALAPTTAVASDIILEGGPAWSGPVSTTLGQVFYADVAAGVHHVTSTVDLQLRMTTGNANPNPALSARTGTATYFDFQRVSECTTSSQCADALECTTDSCAAGFCANPKVAQGSTCSVGVCNTTPAIPACVECVTAANCEDGPGAAGSTCVTNVCVVAAPVVSAPANGSTVREQPVYSGTGPTGATVTVLVDGVSVGTTVVAGGTWSLAQPTALSLGTHTVRARATSGSLVSADSATNNFTVTDVCLSDDQCSMATPICDAGSCVQCVLDDDCPPPSTCGASACVLAAPVIVTPLEGDVLGETLPTFTGASTVGTSVIIEVDAMALGAAVAVDGDGKWTITVTTPLAFGAHSVRARATAGTGVVATSPDSVAVAFTVIDDCATTADCPTGAICDAAFACAVDAPVVSSPADGSTIAQTQPTFAGTAQANTIVTVLVDGAPVGTVNAATGQWSLVAPASLMAGVHTVSATAAAGAIVSPVSGSNTFTISIPGGGGDGGTDDPDDLGRNSISGGCSALSTSVALEWFALAAGLALFRRRAWRA